MACDWHHIKARRKFMGIINDIALGTAGALSSAASAAIIDLIQTIGKHPDPEKLARDLAAEAAHRVATDTAIDAALRRGDPQ
jgi:hypothetical protein